MASQGLATYSPNTLAVIITQDSTGISHRISGFSEDSLVSIDRNMETFSLYVGADNTSTRIANVNTSATMTVSLQQTSASNDILSQLYENDRQSLDSSGLFNITVTDLSGRSVYFSDQAYVASPPSSPFANSMQTREWMIHLPNSTIFLGGNQKLSSEDVATLEALGATVPARWQA
ncbi:hypothetical protein D3C86_1083000 [compost metagenome]